ncbi:hypothetical protein Verru16b_03397 [Lacunisphaera limnophila]|uniref:Uncharacterized protein n=1 Tax=Lacunisphaera limnophila TaxID=1838286 RepID=A0A1D8AZH2_9BACT|nr:hypothetical protein [Lacunisphaera limnophila]AOS46296.1 hypothetical protein Verru16b_03397 [Lacunisphaera limnophila]
MEQPLDPLNAFRPRTGTADQWNAAFIRVEDYLRAHRVHNRLQQITVLQKVIARAAARHEQNPSLDPTTLAAEEIDRMMDEWFGELLGDKNLPHERIAVEGRVALLLSDGVERWPYAFLDEQHVPPEFASEMQRRSIQAGPDMTVTSMVPREIELGTLTEVAGQTFEQIEKWPILRVSLLWAVFLSALALVFYATR